MRVPHVRHFVATKVMQWGVEIPIDRGHQVGHMVICLALPDVQLSFRLLQVWLAYYQVFIPYAPGAMRSGRQDVNDELMTYQISLCPGMSVSGYTRIPKRCACAITLAMSLGV